MAKFILFLLAIGLVTASNSKADQQQRQKAMAWELPLLSRPDWVQDMAEFLPHISNTVHWPESFYKRELGPLGPIFRAVSRMPEKSAADVRSKLAAFDASGELMRHLFQQLLVPNDDSGRTAYDDNLAQRRQAMAEAVRLAARNWSADPLTIHRLHLFVRQEMGPLEHILFAIRNMPENSADDVRVKDEAFDAAMELQGRKLELLRPDGCPNKELFTVGTMPETTADEVRIKEEARAVAKALMSHLLDRLLSVGAIKIHDDL